MVESGAGILQTHIRIMLATAHRGLGENKKLLRTSDLATPAKARI